MNPITYSKATTNTIRVIYFNFSDRPELFPIGGWFAFHRTRGTEHICNTHNGSHSSWRRLRVVLSTRPGHLDIDKYSLSWHPA